MTKICSGIHEGVIDVFREKNYIPAIEKLSFHISHVMIIGSMEYGKTKNDCYQSNALNIYNLKNIMQKDLANHPV